MTYSELTLSFDVKPIAHQSMRIAKSGIKYTPKRILDYKKHIILLTLQQLPKDFEIIKAGTPICIEYLHYSFKYSTNFSKKLKEEPQPRTGRPDLLDNLNKALMDALEGIVFEKDENIVECRMLKKFYSHKDNISLKLIY